MLLLTWKDKKSGDTKFVRFDAVTDETHESVLQLTKHPVEDGSSISDHASDDPQKINIVGYVSNKPLYSNPYTEKYSEYQSMDLDLPKVPSSFSPTPGGLTRAVTGFVDNLLNPPPSKATVFKPKGDFPDRAYQMYETLKEAQKNRARVTVSSSMQELEDMIIVRLQVPRSTEDGNGATFHLDLEQVTIVQSETVAAPSPVEARGMPNQSQGSKQAVKEDKSKDEKKKTLLKRLEDAGADGLGKLGKAAGIPGL